MAAIDDLKSAVNQLQSDVNTLIARPSGTLDADIQAVTAEVVALDQAVQAKNNS